MRSDFPIIKKQRVHSFNEKIGVHTVFNAHKPAKKGYFYAMELMNTRPENTIFVGDQLFTDIFGAKRIGLKNFLVKPINEKGRNPDCIKAQTGENCFA